MEIWKDAIGYEDLFKVSDKGRVFSKRTNKVLKPVNSKTGYLTIPTKVGGRCGKYLTLKVHRLVADAFISNPENKPFVNHIDYNKCNNCVDNLEWVTSKENYEHSAKVGRMPIENFKNRWKDKVSLTKEDIIFIKTNAKPFSRECSFRGLAKKLGVHHSTIASAFYS